jgi:sodium/hydrogen exchanger-like protein 6/7
MLEILGIRTGVEEDEDSSDEEDHWSTLPGGMAMQNGPGSRRYAGQNGRSLGGGGYRSGRKGRGFLGANGGGDGYQDAEEGDGRGGVYSTSPSGSTSMLPRDSYRTSIGDRLDHPPPRSANAALARGFSTNTSSSEEDEEERSDDGELLPSAHSLDLPRSSGSRHHQPAHPPRQHPASPPKSGLPRRSTSGRGSPSIATGDGSGGSREGMVFRDGQWFTALDERYLLPLFSNSVASRRHHARRQSRMASAGSRGVDGGERGVGEEGSSGEEEGGESENGKVKQPPNNFRSV